MFLKIEFQERSDIFLYQTTHRRRTRKIIGENALICEGVNA